MAVMVPVTVALSPKLHEEPPELPLSLSLLHAMEILEFVKVGPLHVWSLMEKDIAVAGVGRDVRVVVRRREVILVMVRFMAGCDGLDKKLMDVGKIFFLLFGVELIDSCRNSNSNRNIVNSWQLLQLTCVTY